MQNLKLPQWNEETTFIIKDERDWYIYSQTLFDSWSLSLSPQPELFIPSIITNIQDDYSGNLQNCEDLWVPIPIISDESQIQNHTQQIDLENSVQNIILLWALIFVWIVVLGIIFIRKTKKKKN